MFVHPSEPTDPTIYWVWYGFPWIYGFGLNDQHPSTIRLETIGVLSYPTLIGDVLLAIAAIAVLTCLSTFCQRAVTRWFSRRFVDVES